MGFRIWPRLAAIAVIGLVLQVVLQRVSHRVGLVLQRRVATSCGSESFAGCGDG
jgi:hypothetical protein